MAIGAVGFFALGAAAFMASQPSFGIGCLLVSGGLFFLISNGIYHP